MSIFAEKKQAGGAGIEAVVLDIGNVLIGWQPERFFDREVGPARRRALFRTVDLHGMNERVDLGGDFEEILGETAALHPEFAAEIELWRVRWIDLLGPVLERSLRCFRALKAAGVPVFALSNFGVEPFRRAEAVYGFLGEFDARFLSGERRMAKPDAALYRALEHETGVAPGGLLFTDDRAENIAAAAARGWRVHLFDGAAGWAQSLTGYGLLNEEQAR